MATTIATENATTMAVSMIRRGHSHHHRHYYHRAEEGRMLSNCDYHHPSRRHAREEESTPPPSLLLRLSPTLLDGSCVEGAIILKLKMNCCILYFMSS